MNKLSICVPTYNRPDLTVRTLESVLRQTERPFEVLVLDNCSTEDMTKVKDFCVKNDFKYQRNEKNIGMMGNMNKTIELAKGEFWCPLHNDDLISPRYVETCVEFTKRYPSFDIWITNGCAVDEKDKVTAEFRIFNKDKTINKGGGLKMLYKNGFYTFLSIIGSTVYRASFIKTHLFDPNLGNEADLDNALRFLTTCDIKYVDTAIYFTRIHKAQESSRIKQTSKNLEDSIRIRIELYRKYSGSFDTKKVLAPVYLLHLAQLSIKYRSPFRTALSIVGLSKLEEVFSIVLYLPRFLMHNLRHKIFFVLRKNKITNCLENGCEKKRLIYSS